MSIDDPAARTAAQAFGFHQLRQACEISTLRQEITRVLANTADLQILIENEVEQVRQRLGQLAPEDLTDVEKLSPLLSEAVTALIEIREASRRLEVTLSRRDAPQPTPQQSRSTPRPPPVEPWRDVSRPRQTAAAPAERAPEAPPPPPPPPPPRAPTPTAPPAPPIAPAHPNTPSPSHPTTATRAKATNWLLPANH